MNRLQLATSRAALRQNQSGAVMFLVTMTLSVLASVGLYALAAATSEVTASGSARQATQTHYLAEYGVVAGAHLMSASRAQTYLATMINTPDTGCWSLPSNVSTTQTDPIARACSHLASTEIATADSWDSGNTFPTSYGQPEATPNFIVEYTGLAKASSPPNYALNLNICFVEMTASAYGSTMPPTSTQATPFGQGIETQRARLLAGPVSGAICQ
jgi:hypothetical protein